MPLGYLKFIDPLDDRRRKIHPDQHPEIRRRYSDGESQNKLAGEYGVSKSLIAIIVNPDRAAAVAARVKEHWKEYSDRADLTAATRTTRKRKRKIGLSYPEKRR
jgi:hypothetical protein